MTRRPHANCYWVKPPGPGGCLLAGEYPAGSRRRLRAHLRAGLTIFVDLTDEGELAAYAPALRQEAQALGLAVDHQRLAIPDFGVPTVEHMRRILDTLDEALAAGRGVYLHCWGGVGRTGTVAGCYLVRHGLSGDAALRRLADWWQTVEKRTHWPRTPETPEQVEFIRGWSE